VAGTAVLAALGGCGDGDDRPSVGATTTAATPTTGATTTTSAPASPYGSVEEGYSGDGPRVAILGDSIIVLSSDAIHEALDARYATRIGAVTGEGLGGGPLSTGLNGRPFAEATAETFAGDRPDVLVLALGTNDAWLPELGLDAALAGLTTVTGLFPDSCLVAVLVNDWSEAERYDRTEAAAINEALVARADVVVESLGPEETIDDMIHPNPAGLEAMARGIAEGVDRCER
jgi:lysophospholipase L1-like esterase